jgi:hypothetical protein
MGFLPGWDSADSTAAIAHDLHITAIIVLGLLFVSEGLALMYDSRKEHLVGVAAFRAEAQRKSDVEAAEARRKADVDSLQEKLAAAQKAATDAAEKAKRVEAQQADRRLTDVQKQAILAAISPFPGQKAGVLIPLGDGEALRYAEEFVAIFRQAKWDITGSGITQGAGGALTVGIQVAISAANGAVNKAPIGAGLLMKTMMQLGIIREGFSSPDVQGDDLLVTIGRKPNP